MLPLMPVIQSIAGTAVELIVNATLIVVLALLMLLRREELRNRLLHLLGTDNLISATRTRNGLNVKAVLDTREYDTGRTVTAEQVKRLQLKGHAFHPDWNYTLSPTTAR